MRVRTALAALVLLLAGLLAPAPAAAATASASAAAATASASAAASARPPGNPRLQALLDELVANGASGALARVDDGRHTWRLAAGAARLEPRQRLTPAARFRVGSVTKSFVSTVTLQLVGRKRLRLDDTVERWVPGLVPNGDGITLRMLLNHTSGLFDYTDDPAFLQRIVQDPTRPATPRELVAVATAHPPTFPPGTGWAYSNTNYIVTGLILQAATHRSVERLVRDRILRPLGLRGTYFPARDPDIAGYHAHGYAPPALTGAGYVDVTRFAPSLAWTAGAIVSTVDDLDRFYTALLGGRLLRPAQLREMTTTVRARPTVGYGLGLFAERRACGTVWGHDGGIPGYVTFAFTDRSGRRGAVVALPTQPDQNLAELFGLTVDTAVCQMFGRVPPSGPAVTRVSPMGRDFASATR
jgi:D-alanyl-D-alanine carboxypeptidase